MTAFCPNASMESVTPLFGRFVHDILLEFSPRCNQPLPQFGYIPDWRSVDTYLHDARCGNPPGLGPDC